MRELVSNVDGAGLFIASQFLRGIAEQLLGSDRAAGFEDDEGNGHLAPLGIGLSTDAGFFHGGMGSQDGFDLGRVDILTSGDDKVCAAVEDIEVAICIKVADVTCGEPAVLKRRGCRLWSSGIARGDGWAFQQYLARLARRSWPVIMQDAQLDRKEWTAG